MNRKRKRYFISGKFQLKYIAYILLFLYAGAAIGGYTVYYTTWVILGEKLANVYPAGRLVYIFHAANMTLLFRILLITPIFAVIGMFLSHRIAGPIYRIGTYIDSLIQGDYSRDLRLRKRDELKSVAAKLSELRRALADEKTKRSDEAASLIALLERKNLDKQTLEEIKSKLPHPRT
ncbi:MAG: hypothetical protein ABIH74_02425 [Candidatus Omnitrophota bacterium]